MIKEKNIKKIKPIIFIILLLCVSIIGVSFAYFTVQKNISNKFKIAAFDIKIEEDFYDDWGTKKVSISNNDELDVVLRVSYSELWNKNMDERLLLLSNQINGQDVVKKEWTETWLKDFKKGNDGWYYYKKILKGKSKISILERISLDNEVINNPKEKEYYTQYDYELAFDFEAIPAIKETINDNWELEVELDEENNAINWKL